MFLNQAFEGISAAISLGVSSFCRNQFHCCLLEPVCVLKVTFLKVKDWGFAVLVFSGQSDWRLLLECFGNVHTFGSYRFLFQLSFVGID